jgi:hypothetical protein
MERGHPVRLSAQREQINRFFVTSVSGLCPLADRMSALHQPCSPSISLIFATGIKTLNSQEKHPTIETA